MTNSQYVHLSTSQSHSPTNFEHIIWREISIQLDNVVLGMSCHVPLRGGQSKVGRESYVLSVSLQEENVKEDYISIYLRIRIPNARHTYA